MRILNSSTVRALKKAGSQDMTIVMGDFNAKVGNEQNPLLEVVGRHGLGSRIERRDIWVDSSRSSDNQHMVPAPQ